MDPTEEKTPMLNGNDESIVEEERPLSDRDIELKTIDQADTDPVELDMDEQMLADPPSNPEKVTDLDASTPGSESPPLLPQEVETPAESPILITEPLETTADSPESPREFDVGGEPHDGPVYRAVTAPLTPEDKPVKPPRMRSMKRDSSQRPVIPAPPTPVRVADVELGGITSAGDQQTPLMEESANISTNHGGDTLIRPAKQRSVRSTIEVKSGKCSLDTILTNKWLLLGIILFIFLVLVIIIIGVSVTRPKPLPRERKPDPVVYNLYCGKAVGVWEEEENVAAFKGIPYLKPPIDNLRWKKEELKIASRNDCISVKFNHTYKAQEFGVPCLQVREPFNISNPSIGSEDCLTVNVWTPNYAAGGASPDLLPVLVYLDGRMLSYGFVENGPDASTASRLNAVVVSFNYRLNVFGWLATSADQSNYGLYDCEQALLWVRKYIENFGGDPKRVTVSGLRSAGTLIYSLMMAQDSLFQRAWISGASTKFQPASEDIYNTNIQAFAKNNHCQGSMSGSTSASDLLACLANRTGQQLLDSLPWTQSPTWEDRKLMTFPVKDEFVGPMLLHGASLDDWNNAVNISVIIGSTQYETLRYQEVEFVNQGWGKYADSVRSFFDGFDKGTANDVLNLYPDLKGDPALHMAAIVSDIRVHCPNNNIASTISTSSFNSTNRYRYIMSADPSPLLASELGGSTVATHGLDFLAVFRNLPDASEQFKSLQSRLRDNIREFVHSGRVPSWEGYPSALIDISNNADITTQSWNSSYCSQWQQFIPDYSWIN